MPAPGQIENSDRFIFRIYPEKGFALVVMSGSFTTFQLADAMTAIYKSPQWKAGMNVVWDLRRISSWDMEWDETRSFVELDSELAPLSGGGSDFVLVANDLHWMNIEAYATISRDNPRSVIPAREIGSVADSLQVPAAELSQIFAELDREC